ncbi:hypothetical protein [Mycoplasma suis]|uniref:Uncharacterized protein n=1 Tax=Mycoplasma suis (strain Illinois) TaxID=768700 RepID=F0QQ11_MYCSL|nr:hypothetical protein [Mycoplasma suis]ADX97581.1 hypothetical protein MSU_0037 [Mycoplasma suis str. Illinois]
MAFFGGLSTKILSIIVLSLSGSGAIAGSAIYKNSHQNLSEDSEKNFENSDNNLDSQKEGEISPSLTINEESAKTSPISSEGTQPSPQPEVLLITKDPSLLQEPASSKEQLTQQSLDNSEQINLEVSSLEKPKNSTEETTKKSRKPRREIKEVSIQEKIEQEIKQRKISLESLYKDSVGGETQANYKACVFYQENEEFDENDSDISEGRTKEDESHDSCDGQTIWSSNKFDGTKGKGFWVRGQEEMAKKLLEKNLSELETLGFANSKEINDSSNIFSNLKNDVCLVNHSQREEKKWVEISCSFEKSNELVKEI